MSKAESNTVFTSPLSSSFVFRKRRESRRKTFKIPILDSVIELGLQLVANPKATGQNE